MIGGPWIKMRKALLRSIEVRRMAVALRLDRDSVLGKLFRFWVFADDTAQDDGLLVGVTIPVLDSEMECDGFSEAIIGVGWLEERDEGLLIPSFDKFLGAKHRSRAANARRARKYRAKKKAAGNGKRHGSVTRDGGVTRHDQVTSATHKTETKTSVKSGAPNPSGSTHLGARGGALDSPAPEPVKKSSSKAKPKAKKRPAFDWREDLKATEFACLAQHPGFEDAWDGWLAQRRALKIKPLTQASMKSTWRKWKHDPEGCLAAIEFSTAQNYQGLIPDPSRQNGSGGLPAYSRQPTGQEVVASLRRKMAAQRESDGEAPRDVAFEPLFKTLPMPVKREA